MAEQMKLSKTSCSDVKCFTNGRKHNNGDIFSCVSDKTGRLSTLELTNMSLYKGKA